MYYSSNTNFFLIHANFCAQKSWNRTYPGFDPVTPLKPVNWFEAQYIDWFLYDPKFLLGQVDIICGRKSELY